MSLQRITEDNRLISVVRPDIQAPVIDVRCLGGFRIAIDGEPANLSAIRPKARTFLRLLASRAGDSVHEDYLVEALWLGMPRASARRNLQVAASAARRLLEPSAERGQHRLLLRDGAAYRLALGPGSRSDVAEFRSAVVRWRKAKHQHVDAQRRALRSVLAAYGGDLLPEDGPAEWVVADRELLRGDAARAATELAAIELNQGNPQAAIDAAEISVRLDPYRDQAWRLLSASHELTGNLAAATLSKQQYDQMLDELGVARDSSDGEGSTTR
ncbi:AfsR/SARP family transcriptional regulator [Kribbella sp. CA-253562]|uniref:AfsR/SARP family transcriptional regulator n=1 Tax=Kribbella sp. CA-253562 TaxID=3239942 RepID=UPI003D8BCA56